MDGILNLYKPAGITSHDAVDEVRRILVLRRVGHAGTLDPMATGVLIVCLGRATRLSEYLMGLPKQYRATVVLGRVTDTDDAEGRVTQELSAAGVTREDFERACSKLTGEIEQAAPVVSALKQNGVPMYRLARQGRPVEKRVRRVQVHSIRVESFSPGEKAEAVIVVDCGRGTYIRSLCADIGRLLGCGGHMGSLERTRVGGFSIEDSVTLGQLQTAASDGSADCFIVPCSEALSWMPAALLDEEAVRDLVNGRSAEADVEAPDGATVRALDSAGKLIAIGEVTRVGGQVLIRPRKVLRDAED